MSVAVMAPVVPTVLSATVLRAVCMVWAVMAPVHDAMKDGSATAESQW